MLSNLTYPGSNVCGGGSPLSFRLLGIAGSRDCNVTPRSSLQTPPDGSVTPSTNLSRPPHLSPQLALAAVLRVCNHGGSDGAARSPACTSAAPGANSKDDAGQVGSPLAPIEMAEVALKRNVVMLVRALLILYARAASLEQSSILQHQVSARGATEVFGPP